MLNLVRKDFFILRWQYAIVGVYVFFYGLLMTAPGTALLLGVTPPILMMMMTSRLEARSHGLPLAGTLPVTRDQIVKARYMTVLLQTALGIGVTTAMSLFSHYALGQENGLSWETVAYAVGIVLLFSSIFLPVYYWLGAQGAHLFAFAAVFLLAFAILGLSAAGSGLKLTWGSEMISSLKFGGLVASVSGLAFLLSGWLSQRIFRRKDMIT
ncbi:ABC-2 transporter permease [Cohnella boryungensis]|uniref:ABC-2 transporter permease n=1 Tax=Cohnella boryungensis TaxID=768479 RepID=A0ABV8SL51_9BACL